MKRLDMERLPTRGLTASASPEPAAPGGRPDSGFRELLAALDATPDGPHAGPDPRGGDGARASPPHTQPGESGPAPRTRPPQRPEAVDRASDVAKVAARPAGRAGGRPPDERTLDVDPPADEPPPAPGGLPPLFYLSRLADTPPALMSLAIIPGLDPVPPTQVPPPILAAAVMSASPAPEPPDTSLTRGAFAHELPPEIVKRDVWSPGPADPVTGGPVPGNTVPAASVESEAPGFSWTPDAPAGEALLASEPESTPAGASHCTSITSSGTYGGSQALAPNLAGPVATELPAPVSPPPAAPDVQGTHHPVAAPLPPAEPTAQPPRGRHAARGPGAEVHSDRPEMPQAAMPQASAEGCEPVPPRVTAIVQANRTAARLDDDSGGLVVSGIPPALETSAHPPAAGTPGLVDRGAAPVDWPAAEPPTAEAARPLPLDLDLVRELAVRARLVLKDNGSSEIRLALYPESLGELHLRAMVTQGRVTASIATDSAEVKDYLDRHLGLLQTALAEQGLRVDRIEVQQTDRFAGGPAGDRRSSAQHEPPPGMAAPASATATPTGAAQATAESVTTLGSGVIDLLV